MPQFDKITFFNQIFWLFAFFSGFYFIFLKIFLPKLSSVLKARQKKLQKGSQGLVSFSKEQDKTFEQFNSAIQESSISVKGSVLNTTENIKTWLDVTITDLNKNKLNSSNSSIENFVYKQHVTPSIISNLTK